MQDRSVRHWEDVYRKGRADQFSWFQPTPEQSLLALDRARAEPSDAIIDVGGGASHLADCLLDRGWSDITILDISAAALANSRDRLAHNAKDVDWIAGDILAWEPPRRYDVWHDRAVFHFFTDPADRAAYREKLQRALAQGGAANFATFAPDGPEKCSGLPVQRYDAQSLSAELGKDFRLETSWADRHETPGGATQNFTWAIFRHC